MKMKFIIIIVLFILKVYLALGHFEKGTSFVNASLGYRKTSEKSQSIGFDKNSDDFVVNFGYNYFFKRNKAVSIELGYSKIKNRLEYSAGGVQRVIQNSNGFEGGLAFVLYNKKKSNFFVGHRFDVRYSLQKSQGQFNPTSSLYDIDSEWRTLYFTASPVVLNYQINKQFFISLTSFLTLSASYREYRETEKRTSQVNLTTQSDYQVVFLPIMPSISVSYLIDKVK
jgi:hypothetical protein